MYLVLASFIAAGVNGVKKGTKLVWKDFFGNPSKVDNEARVEAGVTRTLPLSLDEALDDMEEADWDFVMDTNVKGTFLMSRAVLRGMFRRKSGVILNLGSLAGVRMIEAPVHYYTSKAAIKGFTEVLAKEVSSTFHGTFLSQTKEGVILSWHRRKALYHLR